MPRWMPKPRAWWASLVLGLALGCSPAPETRRAAAPGPLQLPQQVLPAQRQNPRIAPAALNFGPPPLEVIQRDASEASDPPPVPLPLDGPAPRPLRREPWENPVRPAAPSTREVVAPGPTRRLPPVDETDPLPPVPPLPSNEEPAAAPAREVAVTPEPTLRPEPRITLDPQAAAAVDFEARRLIGHALAMAQRGAHYSARAEMIEALRLIAESLDTAGHTRRHATALGRGLKALEEADEFLIDGGNLELDLDLSPLVRIHHTPVLKDRPLRNVTRLAAMQLYYDYARGQLTLASGGMASASDALYALARLQPSLRRNGASASTARSMVLYQAALAVDGRNHVAANELGVLLARCRQWREAEHVLLHAARSNALPEAWANLAAVHANLGESQLAQRAQQEATALAARLPEHRAANSASGGVIRWVDRRTFTALGGAPLGPR